MRRRRSAATGHMQPSDELTRAIKETRLANGYTHHSFARYLKRDYVSVWRWEAGQRVPHRTALVEMLKMAPASCRHVFEEYIGKTLEQVLYEEFLEASAQGPELDPNWSKDPEGHVDGIYTALTERVNLLRSEARMGYSGAVQDLVKLLESAMKMTASPRRRR